MRHHLGCAVDVACRQQCSELGIARDDRANDGRVLGPVLVRALAAVRREDRRRALAQRAHHVSQDRIGCDAGQGFMKVGVVVVKFPRVGVLRDLGALGNDLLEAGDQLRLVPTGGELRVEGFERGPHFDQFPDQLWRIGRDRRTAARLDRHNAIGCERTQGLAYLHPGNAELFGEASLNETIAGREGAVEDAFADRPGDQ
jgi:hypothetical protein